MSSTAVVDEDEELKEGHEWFSASDVEPSAVVD